MVIFATAVVVSVCTFLLQWGGCCIQHTDHTGTHVRVQIGWGYGFDMHRGRHMLEEARRQRHEARQQALIANQPKGLPPHVLNHMSSFTLTNTDGHSTNDLDCTICQEDLCQEKVTSLPCGHIFHKRCIRTWLKRKATCPTCRLELTEEILKTKQRPATVVNLLVPHDLEAGTTARSYQETPTLNPLVAHAAATSQLPTEEEHNTSDRSLECYQAPKEQIQHHYEARAVSATGSTNSQLS